MSSVYICGKRGENEDDGRMAILLLYQAKIILFRQTVCVTGVVMVIMMDALCRCLLETVTSYCAARILKRNANLTKVGRISPRVTGA